MATKPETYDDHIARAAALGREHGTNAGSWVTDGNTTETTYRSLLAGLETCDPEVMDSLPSCPLGGEWADSYSVSDLAADTETDQDSDVFDEVATAYETAWHDAMVETVQRACLYVLDDPRIAGAPSARPCRMTRAHFQFVADVVRGLGLSESQREAFASALAQTNPKFNRDRWLRAATEGGR